MDHLHEEHGVDAYDPLDQQVLFSALLTPSVHPVPTSSAVPAPDATASAPPSEASPSHNLATMSSHHSSSTLPAYTTPPLLTSPVIAPATPGTPATPVTPTRLSAPLVLPETPPADPPAEAEHPKLAALKKEARNGAVANYELLQRHRPIRKPGDARKRRRPMTRREQSSLRSAEICRERSNIYPRLLERELHAFEGWKRAALDRMDELRREIASMEQRLGECGAGEKESVPPECGTEDEEEEEEGQEQELEQEQGFEGEEGEEEDEEDADEEDLKVRGDDEPELGEEGFIPIVPLPDDDMTNWHTEDSPRTAKRARYAYSALDGGDLLTLEHELKGGEGAFVYGIEREHERLFTECVTAGTPSLLLSGADGAVTEVGAPTEKTERLTPTSIVETERSLPDLVTLPSSISVYGSR